MKRAEGLRKIEGVMLAIAYEGGDGSHMAVRGGRQVSVREFIEPIDAS